MTDLNRNTPSETTSSDIEKQQPSSPTDNAVTTVNGRAKKGKIRTGDKNNEEVVIPKNRLVVVFIGLMLATFLAALDQTIVCT